MASAYVLNKLCKKHGVKPIFANEMYIAPGSNLVKERLDDFKPSYHIVVIAKNNIGYKNLMRLTSDSYLKGKYYKARTSMSKLSEFKEGLIITSACIGSYPAQMFLQGREEEAEDWIVEIHSIFGSDFYLEVQYSGLIEQEQVNKFYKDMSDKYNIEVIITSDSHYVKKEDSDYHQALVNIHIGGKITKKVVNKSDSSSEKDQDETGMYYTPEEYFIKSGEDLMSSGKFNDFPEALSITNKIAEQCNVDFITGGKFIPKIEDVYDDDAELKEICNISLVNFIINNKIDYENSIVYNKRLEYELEIIKKMEFSRYFLVVSEYVSWAKDNNIMVGGGRGCNHPDNNIITNKGIVPIIDIKINDMVLTIDGSFQCVEKVFKYSCDESIVRLYNYYGNNNGEGLTLDHKVFAIRTKLDCYQTYRDVSEPEWIKSKDIKVGYKVFIPNQTQENLIEPLFKYDSLILTPDVLWLLGYWIGDGWLRKYCKKRGYNIGLAFNNTTKKDSFIRAIRILKSLGFDLQKAQFSKTSNLIQQSFNSESFYKMLESIFPGYVLTSQTKQLPVFFRSLSDNQLTSLVSGLVDSDGNIASSKISYCTTSKILANELREVYLRLNIPSSIRKADARVDNRGYNSSDTYYVNIPNSNKDLVEKSEEGYWTRIRKIESEPFKGFVYDLKVKNNCNYCTDSFLIHNSGAGSLVALITNITSIDPIKYGLLFERFLSRGRAKKPLIDFKEYTYEDYLKEKEL